jgi:glycosyltransferase involved in cell wall biosynthesis
MRVGVYIPDLSPDTGGGYTFEHDILENLAKFSLNSRHTFTIFFPTHSEELINFLKCFPNLDMLRTEKAAPLKVRIVRRINKFFDKHKQYLGDLNYAAQKKDIDVMWFITPVYQPVNMPYIATIWDLQHRLQPWFPEVGFYEEWLTRENFYSSLIQRASYIITGTHSGADEISSFYQIPKERIRLLPHPTPSFTKKDDTVDPFVVLQKYHLPSTFLFYPAQFWPHKNHVNLLHALKILRDKHKLVINLILVGSEKGNRGYIQKLIETMQIETQVRILGFVSREELIALYRSAFALVYMSFFGPENLPPLEAFALGCPVIASAVHGAEEQLGDAAILVDPADPENIAMAIMDLIMNPSIRTGLIERGQKRASQWTGEDFVRGIFDILDEFETVRRSWK